MKKIVQITILVLILFSCNSDLLQEKEQNSFVELEEIKVKNERLYFPNKKTFQFYYEDLKKENEIDIADVLENKFYSKGFYSLVPIVNSKTERKEIQRHISKIKNNTKGLHKSITNNNDIIDDFDDLEEIFGEEVFTSFLNQQGEIQIADKIYKYTDTGLFIAKTNQIDSLNDYLDSNQISTNLLIPTDTANKILFIGDNNPCGGTTSVDDYEYFIAERDCLGTSGGGGSTPPESTMTPIDQIAEIANTMSACDVSEPWLGNIFGTVKVCKDKYEDKRRVKTKYYNLDLNLAYVIGVNTKHQKKGWVFWHQEKTQQVALGVNSLTWKFPAPQMPAQYWGNRMRTYLYDGKMYSTTTSYYNAVYMGNIPLPALPFADKLDFIVEFAIDVGFFDNEREVTQFFYSNLFNAAKGILQTYGNRDLRKAGVVIVTPSATWVQFYDFSNTCTDCSKIQNTIDFGIATPQITYTFGAGSGFSGDTTFTSWDFNFNQPDLTGMSAYGMAKYNNQWHGTRMEF